MLVILLGITNCNKIKAKKLEGTYIGTSETLYYNGSYSEDSSFVDTLNVDSKKKDLIINSGWVLPYESLTSSHSYSEGDNTFYREISFWGDSVYYYTHSGGLGGGSNFSFTGKKQ